MIDVQCGARIKTGVEEIKWAIGVIQETVDVPCCIDSSNPEALKAGFVSREGKLLSIQRL